MNEGIVLCSIHNMPSVGCNYNQYFCELCYGKGAMTFEDANQKQNETINKYLNKIDSQVEALQNLMNEINQYKTNIVYFSEKFLNEIVNYMTNIHESKSQIKNLLSQTITLKTLDEKCEDFLEQNCSKAKQFFQERALQFQKQCSFPEINRFIAEMWQEPNNVLEKPEIDFRVNENSIIPASRKTTQVQLEIDQNEEDNQKTLFKTVMELRKQENISFTSNEKTRSMYICKNGQSEDEIRPQTCYNINEFFGIQQECEQQSYLENTQLFLEEFFQYKKFIYEQLSDSTLKSSDQNLVFLFNNVTTLLFVGQYDKILVYQFDQGVIKQKLQTLKGHQDTVNCLYFMNKQNLLVSGSTDKTIIIWSYANKMNWQASIQLYGHEQLIFCLIGNQSENLLLSGSGDKTIKIWKQEESRWRFWKEKKWTCLQTINTEFMVYSLSLNNSQSKLIASGSSDIILVFESAYGKQWVITQKIQVDEQGYRSCFTYDDQFVFQSKFKKQLDIFCFNHEQGQFEKKQQVQLQSHSDCVGYTPCQFILSKGILMVKHGKFINLLTPIKNREFILEQSIEFTGYYIYGTMSSDAEYLIAQDMGSKEIQIRKIKYIE